MNESMTCRACGSIYLDKENQMAILDFGMCLGCDHVRFEVEQEIEYEAKEAEKYESYKY